MPRQGPLQVQVQVQVQVQDFKDNSKIPPSHSKPPSQKTGALCVYMCHPWLL
jgi:hypothetical protein